jgi:hypothetical protein
MRRLELIMLMMAIGLICYHAVRVAQVIRAFE